MSHTPWLSYTVSSIKKKGTSSLAKVEKWKSARLNLDAINYRFLDLALRHQHYDSQESRST